MTEIKTSFDQFMQIFGHDDLVFEGPGWIVGIKGGVTIYSEKPSGTTEKAFTHSYSLLRFNSVSLEPSEHRPKGDPPCPTCGGWLRSENKLAKHMQRHEHRRGIGYVARMKRLREKHRSR